MCCRFGKYCIITKGFVYMSGDLVSHFSPAMNSLSDLDIFPFSLDLCFSLCKMGISKDHCLYTQGRLSGQATILSILYIELNALQEELNFGLVVLGFPCNQFGKQEPGENSEILPGLK